MIGGEQITISDYLAELDTPRNVRNDGGYMNDPICPNCSYELAYKLDVKKCPGCGQRLAWEWYHKNFD